jgi:hypothetical protein
MSLGCAPLGLVAGTHMHHILAPNSCSVFVSDTYVWGACADMHAHPFFALWRPVSCCHVGTVVQSGGG